MTQPPLENGEHDPLPWRMEKVIPLETMNKPWPPKPLKCDSQTGCCTTRMQCCKPSFGEKSHKGIPFPCTMQLKVCFHWGNSWRPRMWLDGFWPCENLLKNHRQRQKALAGSGIIYGWHTRPLILAFLFPFQNEQDAFIGINGCFVFVTAAYMTAKQQNPERINRTERFTKWEQTMVLFYVFAMKDNFLKRTRISVKSVTKVWLWLFLGYLSPWFVLCYFSKWAVCS